MPKLTTDQLVGASLKIAMDDPEGKAKVEEITKWLSQEFLERKIPIYIAVSVFAIMTEGARQAGEKGMGGEQDAVH